MHQRVAIVSQLLEMFIIVFRIHSHLIDVPSCAYLAGHHPDSLFDLFMCYVLVDSKSCVSCQDFIPEPGRLLDQVIFLDAFAVEQYVASDKISVQHNGVL